MPEPSRASLSLFRPLVPLLCRPCSQGERTAVGTAAFHRRDHFPTSSGLVFSRCHRRARAQCHRHSTLSAPLRGFGRGWSSSVTTATRAIPASSLRIASCRIRIAVAHPVHPTRTTGLSLTSVPQVRADPVSMRPKDRLKTDLSHAAAIQIMPSGETPPDVMELGALEVIKQPWQTVLFLFGRNRISRAPFPHHGAN